MIELHDVTKVFPGGNVAVEDVSFMVPKGSITCLIGTSGCGKTTTLKIINRLMEPTSGKITVKQKDIQTVDPITLRRSIGYVIQEVGLLPHMTVRQNISILHEVMRIPKAEYLPKTEELMSLVGLEPEIYAERYPMELSGGEQQRVGIARALMNDPPVLLMDEPFGSLDPITRKYLQDEFLALNERLKKTILLVTHDLTEAFKLGDEIILMQEGKIVQKGSKKDFLQNPANDFVQVFVSSQLKGILP